MKVSLYDKTGKKSKRSIELDKAVWDVPKNEDLVAQVYQVYQDNQRKGTAHSKTRSDVRGGGKKPWRQKGTGRARHGSIRSPLWVGGGVAFGPSAYKNTKKIPKKMQHLAIKILLSQRLRDEQVMIIESLPEMKKPEIKKVSSLMEALKVAKKKVLFVMSEAGDSMKIFSKSSHNIPKVAVRDAVNLNIGDLIYSDIVVLESESAKVLQDRLLKS